MPLTDAKIRAAKPEAKPYKLADGEGLFLYISPAGGKSWRMKFRTAGKEKLLVLGSYPALGLQDARRQRRAAKERIDEGGDPAADKQAVRQATRQKAETTFRAVAGAWHENERGKWDAKYADLIWRRLEDNIFPAIGSAPIDEITPPEMLAALKRVEARGVLETTRRVKQYCSNIFCFAIATGLCHNDPTAPVKRALRPPPRVQHRKRLPRELLGEFLVKLDAYDGDFITRIAIHFTVLTAVRTREIIPAEWNELEQLDDPDKALWRIPSSRMKMKTEHLVPLSRQSVALLQRLPSADTRCGKLFPGSSKGGLLSNNTMLYGLYRLGHHSRATMHGFRAVFSTEANEHDFAADWIERQLAHDERDEVRGAYNAAQYLPQRRRLLQWWADRLDALKAEQLGRKRE
jgi:integrase